MVFEKDSILKDCPRYATRYMARALERDGLKDEVSGSYKPILILGDCPTASSDPKDEKNVGKYINHPTVSINNSVSITNPNGGVYGIGKFEAEGGINDDNSLSIGSIAVSRYTDDKKGYEAFIQMNPTFGVLYNMQKAWGVRTAIIRPEEIKRASAEYLDSNFPKMDPKTIMVNMEYMDRMNINRSFSSVIINGNNDSLDVREAVSLLDSLSISARYIQISDIELEFIAAGMIGQRGVKIAQGFFDKLGNSYIRFNQTILPQNDGTAKVLTMITKPQTR